MIRKMILEDIEQVALLESACFSVPWSAQILESGLSCAYDTFFVFEEEGQIYGYCNLRILVGEGELQRIAVFPQKRNLGIARKMMEALIDYAKKQDVISIGLEVRESNEKAQNLYVSYGFVVQGVRKDYYTMPKESAVMMCLVIQ